MTTTCQFGFEVLPGAGVRVGNRIAQGIPPAFIGGKATTIVQKCAGCGQFHWAVLAIRLHGTGATFEDAREQAHYAIKAAGYTPWKPPRAE